MARCSNCHEFYEDSIDGLHEHMYGDNPYARYCAEVTRVQLAISHQSLLDKILFRIPDAKNHALDELLQHKLLVNNWMRSDNHGKTLEEYLEEHS